MADKEAPPPASLTKVRLSTTLYVKNVPPYVTIDELATLFGQGNQFSGFIRLRRIVNSRGKEMLFVDFNTAFLATQALNRYYGYKFDPNDPRPGLHVDYDKDDTEVKLDRYTRKVKRVEIERSIIRCVCKHCGSHCLNLLCHLRELPVRSVDGSRVIGVSKNLSEIDVTKGATVRIKRTDRNGNPGIEVQYRMECAGCQLPLAYQTKPFTDASNKWIYVLPDAITDTMSEVQTPVFASLVNPHLEQVDANTSSDDSTNQPTASDEGSTTSTLIDSTDASASSTATVPADSSTPTDSLPQVGDKRAREDVNNDDNGTDNQAATDGVSDARSTTAPCSSTESDGSPSTKRPRLSSDE